MIYYRKSSERGYFDHGWLKTFHSFSFGDYYDPKHMGFASLRVINEDWIGAGVGFPTHGHRDMEIVTYVISGAVAHKDSTGSEGIIKPGEVQKMSAGTGIRHSEFNALKDQETHLYQIWILPEKNGLAPGYVQKDFTSSLDTGEAVLLASRDGRDASITIFQDAEIWARRFKGSAKWNVDIRRDDKIWVQVVSGNFNIKGSSESESASTGDGVALQSEDRLELQCLDVGEVLLFKMK